METKIRQTTVSTTETATSELAVYECSVMRVNNILKSITASVITQTSFTNEEGIEVVSSKNAGTINYLDSKISCSGFPFDEKLPLYITEFIEIVNTIKEREV